MTKAVADQAHLQAVRIVARPQANLFDFSEFSDRLMQTFYRGPQLVSGAHKLWILSSRGVGINYGFYLEKKDATTKARWAQYLDMNRGGKYLPASEYTLVQGPGAAHDVIVGTELLKKALAADFADETSKTDPSHWDYSQLLQLMKPSGPLEIDGKSYTMAQALVQGLAPLWDEQPAMPHPTLLRLLGLEPAPPKKKVRTKESASCRNGTKHSPPSNHSTP